MKTIARIVLVCMSLMAYSALYGQYSTITFTNGFSTNAIITSCSENGIVLTFPDGVQSERYAWHLFDEDSIKNHPKVLAFLAAQAREAERQRLLQIQLEAERQRAEAERLRLENERAEGERIRAEGERIRAEGERIRAEELRKQKNKEAWVTRGWIAFGVVIVVLYMMVESEADERRQKKINKAWNKYHDALTNLEHENSTSNRIIALEAGRKLSEITQKYSEHTEIFYEETAHEDINIRTGSGSV